jgi:hypothetical protein
MGMRMGSDGGTGRGRFFLFLGNSFRHGWYYHLRLKGVRSGLRLWHPLVPGGNTTWDKRPLLVPVRSTGTKRGDFCLSSLVPVGLERLIPLTNPD